MERLFFTLGSVSAFLGVALGAFAAHALKGRVEPDLLVIFETGVRYQMYHALALLAVGWACTRWPGKWVNAWLVVCCGHDPVFRQPLRLEFERRALAGRDYADRWACVTRRMAVSGVGGLEIEASVGCALRTVQLCTPCALRTLQLQYRI